jgi:tRNA1Val (adenine37-N6)-methyltransferase
MPLFRLKQFNINDANCTMRVGTDAVLLGCWVETTGAGTILDIGTGSGLIALMLAQKSDAAIDAIDIDETSIRQAQENIRQSPWPERIKAYHVSLQVFTTSHEDCYDLVVSNPPFYTNFYKAADKKKNVARHTDLLTYETLARAASQLLRPGGRCCLILPYNESMRFRELALQKGLHLNRYLLIRPKVNKEVNRIIMEFSATRKESRSEELIIRHTDDSYTREYMTFTSPYYLDF